MKPQHSKLGAMLTVTLVASAAANGATAVTLYDNLGSNPSGSFADAFGPPSNTYVANQFFTTPTLCTPSCELAGVSLYMYGQDLHGNPVSSAGFSVQIYSDVPGGTDSTTGSSVHIPGSPLYTLTNPALFTADLDINVFTPSSTFLLSPNTYYWVRLSSQAADSVYWATIPISVNSQSGVSQPSNSLREDITGIYWLSNPAFDDESSDYYNPPAQTFMMKVEVIQSAGAPEVPIPGAAWLMGSSLAGLMLWRRRQPG